MTASESVMHQMFYNVVAEYHPFATYLGYQEGEDEFLVHYEGTNGKQSMAVDINGNIIADTTVGTTRTMGIVAVGVALLSAFFGDG